MKMKEDNNFGWTDVLMLLTVLIWAVNFSLIKIALRDFSPHGFNGLRLLSASLILVVVLRLSGQGFRLEKWEIWKVIGISIAGNTVYQILFIQGINLTTASNASITLAMGPIFVALLSSSLRHEKIHWAGWLGIFISFFGFYLVISKGTGNLHLSGKSLKGDLMIFLGNFCWAIYTVLAKPLLRKVSPLKLTTITLSIGTLFYLPFAVHDISHLTWKEISLPAWTSLSYSSLFAIVASFLIWYASVKRVGNSKTSIYGNITPVFAALFAHLFLAEGITSFQILGALAIFAGFYLTRSGYRLFIRKEEYARNKLKDFT